MTGMNCGGQNRIVPRVPRRRIPGKSAKSRPRDGPDIPLFLQLATSTAIVQADSAVQAAPKDSTFERYWQDGTSDAVAGSQRLVSWSKDEFLDAPVQNFGDVELVFGGAGDFVNPAELAELLAGFAENTENSSVEREFVDAAGKTVGAEKHLMGRGSDANGPGRAG